MILALQFILIIFLPCLIKTEIKLIAPSQYAGETYEFTIANFGNIPYGQSIVGNLMEVDPTDCCTPKCQLQNKTNLLGVIPVAFIKRGGCNFVLKVKYAESAGAKLVIIYNTDDITQQLGQPNMVIMADDGTGQTVNIPSVFISNADSNKILPYINSSSLLLQASFPVEQKETAEYNFFISTPDNQAYSFISKFEKERQKIVKNTTFKGPVYFLSRCDKVECWEQSFDLDEADCLGGGRYCCFDPDGTEGSATGRQIVYENLRQLCIFNTHGESVWYQYIRYFFQYCSDKPQHYQQCLDKIGNKIDNFTFDLVKKCEQESFVTKTPDQPEFLKQNKLLDQQYILGNFVNIRAFYVVVNNFPYFGNLKTYDIVEIICASLLNPDENCLRILYPGNYTQISKPDSREDIIIDKIDGLPVWAIAFITISILVVVFLIVLIIYKKIVQKEMQQEMSQQVNEMVTNYIKFYDAKDKSEKENL